MQKLIFSLVIMAALIFFSTDLLAQSKKKITQVEFQVEGVCNMCKERIETAAYDVSGVKWVEWDKHTKQLVVKYKTSKVSLEKIHKAIAASGHTTSKVDSKIEDYEDLPNCCQYETEHTH